MSRRMIDYRFAFATPADVPALALLIERAYRGPEAAKGWTNEAEILTGPRSSPEEIAGLIADPEARFLVALDGDRPVACALLKRHGTGAYFGMFAIDPAVQGGGLGKLMMTRADAAVRELWNANYLRLSVISLRDQLIAWYERRGFVQTGQHEPFPFDSSPGALRTDFHLTVLQKAL
ncbi:MAG: GNAT family N-acetyltransferase [Hyphomicrobiales bacterium]|nr:MAG: GNAT family N-acetyltransferase [Hyphomicrobiales bacterium]